MLINVAIINYKVSKENYCEFTNAIHNTKIKLQKFSPHFQNVIASDPQRYIVIAIWI